MRRAAPWLAVLAGLVVVALVVGSPGRDEGSPFDPRSTGSLGTRALVELVEDFGARVDITSELPPAGTDVAVMFSDVVPDDRVGAVVEWVRGGGLLVVTDRFSRFTPTVVVEQSLFGLTAPELDAGTCDVAALAGLRTIAPGDGTRYEVEPGSESCFGDGSEAFVVVESHGDGAVVSLGSPMVFVNGELGSEDNAALATALVAPVPGTRVAVLEPGEAAPDDDRSLLEVMAPGARLALVQLMLGFVAYAWFRSRRLGDPSVEDQPVEISGSELIVAVGNLLQRRRAPDTAADLLRRDLRRQLAQGLGLPPDTAPHVIADVAAARTGADRDRVLAVVADGPVGNDAALVELARSIDRTRKEILHGA
jgi:hypothetical protein